MNPTGAMQPESNQIQSAGRKYQFPNLKVIPIRTLSSFSMVLGVVSIGVQIAALVIYGEELYNTVYFAGDVSGHGIWAGTFYLIAGSLGLAACHQPTTSLLVSTVVFSALSAISAIASGTLAGFSGGEGVNEDCCRYGGNEELCETWEALEWSLMSIAILSFMTNVPLLVLTCVGLCGRPKNRNVMIAPVLQQQPFAYTGNSGQQMYYQPQQVQMTQNHPSYQVAYGQQLQQPYPVQPTAPVKQPETVQVELEVKKSNPDA